MFWCLKSNTKLCFFQWVNRINSCTANTDITEDQMADRWHASFNTSAAKDMQNKMPSQQNPSTIYPTKAGQSCSRNNGVRRKYFWDFGTKRKDKHYQGIIKKEAIVQLTFIFSVSMLCVAVVYISLCCESHGVSLKALNTQNRFIGLICWPLHPHMWESGEREWGRPRWGLTGSSLVRLPDALHYAVSWLN